MIDPFQTAFDQKNHMGKNICVHILVKYQVCSFSHELFIPFYLHPPALKESVLSWAYTGKRQRKGTQSLVEL